MVELFNFYYFFYMFIFAGIYVGLYFLLKNKSLKTKEIVIFSLMLLNLAVHFLKLAIPPYSTNPTLAAREIWFINVCGTSVILFPIYFLSKKKVLRDYVFYLGIISGFLALVYPTEALGEQAFSLDVIRFYITHGIIIIAPLLMVSLKVHSINYRRILYTPFLFVGTIAFIMVQQIIQSELGIISLRNDDFLNNNYPNPSLFWRVSDDLAKFFTIFTPDFMKVVPFGEFKGQEKYWPLLYTVPGIFVYFTTIPFIFNLTIKDSRNILVNDINKIFRKILKPKVDKPLNEDETILVQIVKNQDIPKTKNEEKSERIIY